MKGSFDAIPVLRNADAFDPTFLKSCSQLVDVDCQLCINGLNHPHDRKARNNLFGESWRESRIKSGFTLRFSQT